MAKYLDSRYGTPGMLLLCSAVINPKCIQVVVGSALQASEMGALTLRDTARSSLKSDATILCDVTAAGRMTPRASPGGRAWTGQ